MTQVATAWRQWREIGRLLIKRAFLRKAGKVFEPCIRSVLLYCSEA